jgi:hypothetical protein
VKTSPGRPLFRAAAVVLFAGLGVAACSSQPSAQRVADDLINTCMQESNPCELTPAQMSADPEVARKCMLAKVDEYTKDELNDIGEAADSGDAAAKAAANAELDKLQVELESCLTDS